MKQYHNITCVLNIANKSKYSNKAVVFKCISSVE